MATPTIVTNSLTKCASIANGQLGRPIPFSGWTGIRIGMRMRIEDSGGNLASTTIAFGLTSGSTNWFADASCTHFAGWRNVMGTVTRDPNVYADYGAAGNDYYKKVGVTSTFIGQSPGSIVPRFVMEAGKFGVFMLDIVRASAIQLRTRAFLQVNKNSVDWSREDFLKMMERPIPAATNYTYDGNSNWAVNEGVDGVFDHVYVHWNRATNPLLVADLAITRLY